MSDRQCKSSEINTGRWRRDGGVTGGRDRWSGMQKDMRRETERLDV